MDTQEGNKLIAEFMGGFVEYGSLGEYIILEKNPPLAGQRIYHIEKELKYHSSWDWLMPVVEKIEAIENSDDYEVDIFGNCCEIGTNDNHSAVGKTKVEATWKAVIQFIQWFNQQPK